MGCQEIPPLPAPSHLRRGLVESEGSSKRIQCLQLLGVLFEVLMVLSSRISRMNFGLVWFYELRFELYTRVSNWLVMRASENSLLSHILHLKRFFWTQVLIQIEGWSLHVNSCWKSWQSHTSHFYFCAYSLASSVQVCLKQLWGLLAMCVISHWA